MVADASLKFALDKEANRSDQQQFISQHAYGFLLYFFDMKKRRQRNDEKHIEIVVIGSHFILMNSSHSGIQAMIVRMCTRFLIIVY